MSESVKVPARTSAEFQGQVNMIVNYVNKLPDVRVASNVMPHIVKFLEHEEISPDAVVVAYERLTTMLPGDFEPLELSSTVVASTDSTRVVVDRSVPISTEPSLTEAVYIRGMHTRPAKQLFAVTEIIKQIEGTSSLRIFKKRKLIKKLIEISKKL